MAVISSRRLPLELVIQIAEYLDTQTCATLLRCCHQYAVLLTPILYDPHFEYYDFLPPAHSIRVQHPKYVSRVAGVTNYMERWKSPSILEYFRNLPNQNVNREFTGTSLGTLLHGAVASGNLELTTILLEKGANVNALGRMFRTPLSHTIRDGREDMIRLLIRHGANPMIESPNGVPPLLVMAVKTGSVSLVRFCLEIAQEAGFHFDPGNKASGILLCQGANYPQVVELFLGMGVSPLAESEHRDTALNIAASYGNVNSCRILYEAAVSIIHGDLRPLSRALETAISRDDLEVAKCFIDCGIDIMAPASSRDYINPLEHALKEGRKSIVEAMLASRPELWKSDFIQDMFKAYMEGCWRLWQAWTSTAPFVGLILDLNRTGNAKLDLTIRGWGEGTLLHRFASIDFEKTRNSIAVLHRLLEEPSTDLTSRNLDGDTPLHITIRNHNLEASKIILSACLNRTPEAINLQNNKGKTPLHMALETVGPRHPDFGDNWEKFSNQLINAGVHLDIYDDDGQSPLHIAAAHHHSIALLLVQKGAALGHRDSSGRTAFLIALEHFKVDVACYMLSKSPELLEDINNSPARLIAMKCDSKFLARLFDIGVDATIREPDGGTLLHTAAESGSSPCMEVIISRHPELINVTNSKGVTPLQLSTKIPWKVDIIRKLLDAGADLSVQDQRGRTVLYNAIDHHTKVDCLELIISRDPKLAVAPNADGDTPLHLAARFRHSGDILEKMLEANVDINVRDLKGRTPLHVAALADGEIGYSYNLLLQKGADPTLLDKDGILASDLLTG